MEQRRGDNQEATRMLPSSAFDGKEQSTSTLRTDFSVRSRLLSNAEGVPTADSSSLVRPDAGPQSRMPGWHLLLPTEQGAVSSHHPIPAWQKVIPNVVIGPPSSAAPLAGRSHPLSNHVSSHFSSNRAQVMDRPAGNHGTIPLHHTSYASQPGCSVTVGYGTQPVHGHLQTRNSGGTQPAISRERSMSSPATKGEEEEEEEEGEGVEQGSGDETDGESSSHSHDSHGGTDGIDEPRKPKRTRTAYSNYQLDQLEVVFQSCQYPDVFVREELSNRLRIKEDRIQVWFQNRRARFRKQERTGSISHRSRYRQRRIQKAIVDPRGPIPVYPGYAHQPHAHLQNPAFVLPSPPPVPPPYMPSFPMPGQLPGMAAIPSSTVSSSSSSSSSPSATGEMAALGQPITTVGYIPGFQSLRPTICPPLHGYLPRGFSAPANPAAVGYSASMFPSPASSGQKP